MSDKPDSICPPGIVLTAAQANALQYGQGAMYHRSSGPNSDPGWEAKRDAGLGITPLPTTPGEVTLDNCAPASESSTPRTTAPVLLDAAAGHLRDRAATYDKPDGERSMAKTVDIFNLQHGTSLTEAQGWHLLQILKDVRLFTRGKYHADSAEDCIAYAALKAEAMAK